MIKHITSSGYLGVEAHKINEIIDYLNKQSVDRPEPPEEKMVEVTLLPDEHGFIRVPTVARLPISKVREALARAEGGSK